MPIISNIVRTFEFSRAIVELSDEILRRIGQDEFNGLHLRIESDARPWADLSGGSEV